uniref:Uncharacterized protein n=1 Tax=viral metagenome TaxID=1070528 RepID=A0A6M3LRY0_9ZZZZ
MKTYSVTIDWEVEVQAKNEEEAKILGLERWRDNCEEGMYFEAKEVK